MLEVGAWSPDVVDQVTKDIDCMENCLDFIHAHLDVYVSGVVLLELLEEGGQDFDRHGVVYEGFGWVTSLIPGE